MWPSQNQHLKSSKEYLMDSSERFGLSLQHVCSSIFLLLCPPYRPAGFGWWPPGRAGADLLVTEHSAWWGGSWESPAELKPGNIPTGWERRALVETSALEILTYGQKFRHSWRVWLVSWARVSSISSPPPVTLEIYWPISAKGVGDQDFKGTKTKTACSLLQQLYIIQKIINK